VNRRKLLRKLLSGSRNVRFAEMVNLLEGFGFVLSRIQGSHHIYTHNDIPELVNLQNVKGQIKPYQVRQVIKLIEQHDLRLEED